MNNQISEQLLLKDSFSPELLPEIQDIIMWYYEKIILNQIENIRLANGMISFMYLWVLNSCPSIALNEAILRIKIARAYEEQRALLESEILWQVESIIKQ